MSATDSHIPATVSAWLQHQTHQKPNEEVMVCYSPTLVRSSLTFSELFMLASRMAKLLHDAGLKKGEFVVSSLPTSCEETVASFGVILAGGVSVPVDVFLNTGDTFFEVMNKTKARFLITSKTEHDNVWSFIRDTVATEPVSEKFPFLYEGTHRRAPDLAYSLVLQRSESAETDFLSILRQKSSGYVCPEICPEDLCTVGTTANSTSFVCLVAHTHESLVHSGFMTRGMIGDDSKNYLWTKPPTFLVVNSGNILMGPTHVRFDTWNGMQGEQPIPLSLRIVEAEKINTLFLLPNTLDETVTCWGKKALPIAKHLIFGGMPVTAKAVSLAMKCFDRLTSLYAKTEVQYISKRDFTKEDKYEDFDQGLPYPGVEVRVVDSDRKELKGGNTGCITIKTKCQFHSYVGQPKEDRNNKISEDGFFNSGDAGCMRSDGHLMVVGRNDDMILHNVWNVHPSWIEDNIKKMPGVQQVVVVPTPDEVNFQNICACVIKKPESASMTAGDVKDYFQSTYVAEESDILVPSNVLFFESFPEIRPGVVDRKKLTNLATGIVKQSA